MKIGAQNFKPLKFLTCNKLSISWHVFLVTYTYACLVPLLSCPQLSLSYTYYTIFRIGIYCFKTISLKKTRWPSDRTGCAIIVLVTSYNKKRTQFDFSLFLSCPRVHITLLFLEKILENPQRPATKVHVFFFIVMWKPNVS